MEISVVAEAEEVEFQTLAFDHLLARDVGDDYLRKVRLACLGAERGELRAGEGHEIFVVGVLVDKCLQHFRRILCRVFDSGVAEQRHAVKFLF